jgi:NTP pyrophosphatase (non-canonical NTP hydrolase)
MSKPLLDIMRLNHERYGSDFNFSAAWVKLSEEMDEFTEASTINDTHEMIDALADIITVAAGEITKLGFNPELVLKQTVREITSRKIDPTKEEVFHNTPGMKWPKDPNQDKSTLYKANYNLCKSTKKGLV